MSAKVTAKLSSKFQISLPKAVRTAQRWQAGQEFAFIPKGKGVLLVPVPKPEDLAGLARGANPTAYRDRYDRICCGWSTRQPGSSGSSARRPAPP